MSARDRATLDNIVGEDELEPLGEPDFLDEPLSGETAVNAEFRRYDDPPLDAVTTGAYVLAKDITTSIILSDTIEDAERKAWEAALRFKEELAEKDEENPVFVNEELLELLGGDDRVAAFMRFTEDPHMYPVTLKTHTELLDRLENMQVVSQRFIQEDSIDEEQLEEEIEEARQDYLDAVEDQAILNNFLVPVYANREIPRKIPAASLRTPSDEIVANPEMDMNEYVRDENELEEAGEFSPIFADVTETREGCTVLLDTTFLELDSLDAEYSDGKLVVYENGEPVYEDSLDDLDETVSLIADEEVRNGIYNIELE